MTERHIDEPEEQDPWADPDADGGWTEQNRTYDAEGFPEDEEDSLLYGDEPDGTNPRRAQATTVMAIAVVAFLASLVVLASFLITEGPFAGLFDFLALRVWIAIFAALLALLFVWLLVLLLTTPARADEDWYTEDDIPTADYAEAGAPDTITLRCPRCVNIFSLQDPWTRPFYHVCPSCQVRGVYTGRQDPPEVRAALERYEGQAQSV